MPLTLKQLARRRIVLLAMIVLALISVLALGAEVFGRFDPNDTAITERLRGPGAAH